MGSFFFGESLTFGFGSVRWNEYIFGTSSPNNASMEPQSDKRLRIQPDSNTSHKKGCSKQRDNVNDEKKQKKKKTKSKYHSLSVANNEWLTVQTETDTSPGAYHVYNYHKSEIHQYLPSEIGHCI